MTREQLESELKRELEYFRSHAAESHAMAAWGKIKKLDQEIREQESDVPPGSIQYHQHNN